MGGLGERGVSSEGALPVIEDLVIFGDGAFVELFEDFNLPVKVFLGIDNNAFGGFLLSNLISSESDSSENILNVSSGLDDGEIDLGDINLKIGRKGVG